MTPENFCYWLKGWFELNDSQGFDKFAPSIECVDTIKAHLDLVFLNVTKPPVIGGKAERVGVVDLSNFNNNKYDKDILYC